MELFEKIFGGIIGQDENSRSKEDIDFENQVKNDGYEYAGKRIADILNEKITSQDLARQFVLEELDAARQGNNFAQNFVKSSGFKSFEYVGAINRTKWEGNESELEHLQLFLRGFLIKIRDIDLMVKLSTKVVDEIMKKWGLGKYDNNDSVIPKNMLEDIELSLTLAELNNLYTNKTYSINFNEDKKLVYVVEKKYNQSEGILAEVNNDLATFMTYDLINSDDYEDKLLVMAYGYARRFVAAGLFLQGVFNREGYSQAKKIFHALQVQTGHTIKFQEDAFSQALEYIQSYDNRITREFISLIVGIAENEEIVSIYDLGQKISFEQLIEIFLKPELDDEEIPF